MAKIEAPENIRELPIAIITNILSLATSGFGLVVALAWNEVIKTAVSEFITPFLGKGSGVISLLIYSLVVTVLAVLVTMQLTRIQNRIKKEESEAAE